MGSTAFSNFLNCYVAIFLPIINVLIPEFYPLSIHNHWYLSIPIIRLMHRFCQHRSHMPLAMDLRSSDLEFSVASVNASVWLAKKEIISQVLLGWTEPRLLRSNQNQKTEPDFRFRSNLCSELIIKELCSPLRVFYLRIKVSKSVQISLSSLALAWKPLFFQ